ncbi:class I SAM-dependent methyltransferase [Sulfurimonas sp. SAG-AH-194-C21]|nr:class I SAM-dependent methyltransferase [Sulfurimonas sp. SAG-AH-194-C21]MDF1884228.1 class I SAM-dependent methyltransferase [Sulfurimonas sp. SAG-AH-194-C21]
MHQQFFYKELQKEVLKPIKSGDEYTKTWADVGCSTGLMSRLGHSLKYKVIGFDINAFSLFVARLVSFNSKNITYIKEDFITLEQKFDVVSATSLLSVVDDKKETLKELMQLLRDENSTLIIIEPTQKMTKENVYALMPNFKKFWFYKGLLLWASAREGKAVSSDLFENLEKMNVSHEYFLHKMVRVTYIQKSY